MESQHYRWLYLLGRYQFLPVAMKEQQKRGQALYFQLLLWLQQRQEALHDLRAVGLVVNVDSAAALAELRRLAAGLILSPASGDDLAHRLGLRHYPVLITPTGVEQ